MIVCWGITDGSAGMAAQVRALATALGIEIQVKKITVRKPFCWLPNIWFALGLKALVIPYLLEKTSETLAAPLPQIVISCGRRGAIVALGLQAYARNAKFIHIQDPHISSRHFDAVVAMQHDRIEGDNVIKTHFALHSITPKMLGAAEVKFSSRFAGYPKPHMCVLIGGSTNKYTLTPAAMQQVIAQLQRLREMTQGSLLITASRRTGEDNIRTLRNHFHHDNHVYIYDEQEENPYIGLLALAETIIVTNDSVNMMSEAQATGKPIYLLPLPGHKDTKPARFADRLVNDGIARVFENKIETWQYPASDEMSRVAKQVQAIISR